MIWPFDYYDWEKHVMTSSDYIITRLSKCMLSYQYDTTQHICFVNNSMQHYTKEKKCFKNSSKNNSNKKFFCNISFIKI